MLTFDKIRELERTERDMRKLQKLPDDLMEELKEYLRRKEGMKEKTSSEIRELENVKNTIRHFFEFRENKIIGMALDCVRTGMPPENLTKQEEKAFYEIVDNLKDHRERFFEELHKSPQTDAAAEEEKLEEIENEIEIKAEKEEHKEKTDIFMTTEKPKQYAYKVKKTLPTFVGTDMKNYEFRENEIIDLDTLPKPLNDLLLKEGVIEQIVKSD
jgi:DNA replication initiation complex subunit (GINS family)